MPAGKELSWMLICDFGMLLLGLTFGLMVSGGVFTALLALGLVPRFAGKTHTANKILVYESAVVYGCIVGGILSVYPLPDLLEKYVFSLPFLRFVFWDNASAALLVFGGFFGGCFVGCVALAIAEMLDSIPIFARRIRFREGLGIAVLSVAFGKTLGSILYFVNEIYKGI